MAKKTTQELETELQTLIASYNEAINVQQNCKTRIIAVQAVLEDRKEEEDDTDQSSSSAETTSSS